MVSIGQLVEEKNNIRGTNLGTEDEDVNRARQN